MFVRSTLLGLRDNLLGEELQYILSKHDQYML